ncbi:hypothetical protein F383_29110 [Gossypium arboreum]|uniref:Uncharacterized protein n=1 Tax=Gossypium arboreum TaxID=29729 RepID=A0A0B0PCF2_GOSAR|nr:hypothetical protein F383_29110 [Gossypium arboreum]
MCLSCVRHMVMLHSCVSSGVVIKMKSVCSTRSHTRACDLAVLHKLVYPTGFAQPSTWPGTRACGHFEGHTG